MLKAELVVEGDPEELYQVIAGQELEDGRARVTYEKSPAFKILIEASDVNAMRAAINSQLLLLKAVDKVNESWKSLKK